MIYAPKPSNDRRKGRETDSNGRVSTWDYIIYVCIYIYVYVRIGPSYGIYKSDVLRRGHTRRSARLITGSTLRSPSLKDIRLSHEKGNNSNENIWSCICKSIDLYRERLDLILK